ncbi:hypothetical protein JOB18_019780 [Solea senegalensis]|uniref:Uncharacterized protein n=1 Tax=Solea senegalensis TaxID=28829 RepID=A0AAV6RBG8_SOLSE|nr:hypothetical protein JOB18_019780 [Solea senegalensis]
MCLRGPPPPPLLFLASPFGFLFSFLLLRLCFPHNTALVPAYLQMNGSCHGVVPPPVPMDCKYGSTVPGGYTICTCSFVFEYESKSPHPPLPLSDSFLPLSVSYMPFFSIWGKTGVF